METVNIPLWDFKKLLSDLKRWKDNPNNNAAIALGHTAVTTLEGYDPDLIREASNEL